ncbi:ribosomal-protein-alanine N-acetyltransferase [Alicyclobacillaceae bacterium I2511]|jgi:ribosomal-protein-alanine N-acetyltransferase|nr:ribosomal-protein-alanine N-acetyltransferase [Alicyclobacillaceae bacterium I2511]
MALAEAWDPAAVSMRNMRLQDVDFVLRVERRSFSAPWSRQAFTTELVDNQFARYWVLEYHGRIIGYAGVWLIVDEGHITNIAIDPEFRGRRLGERLMRGLLAQCLANGMKRVTLEVRVTNGVAQNLYRKLGFVDSGVRKGYYTDNREDALIMWAELSSIGPQKPQD